MKAIIIGAGIGGLGTAIALRKIGMDVKVFESKQEVRFAGAGLGIGANAVRALQQLDVGDQILRAGKALDELRILTPAGKILQRTETAAISHKYGPDHVTIERGAGRKGRFGLVPLSNNRIYWFACLNAKAPDSPIRTYSTRDLMKIFEGYHEPIPQILAQTSDHHMLQHDIYDLPPISRFAFGRVVLLGDAAHAMTPNMGQGAGQSVEDAVILASHLKQSPVIEEALLRYERERIGRTGQITRMSDRIGKVAQLQGTFPAPFAMRCSRLFRQGFWRSS